MWRPTDTHTHECRHAGKHTGPKRHSLRVPADTHGSHGQAGTIPGNHNGDHLLGPGQATGEPKELLGEPRSLQSSQAGTQAWGQQGRRSRGHITDMQTPLPLRSDRASQWPKTNCRAVAPKIQLLCPSRSVACAFLWPVRSATADQNLPPPSLSRKEKWPSYKMPRLPGWRAVPGRWPQGSRTSAAFSSKPHVGSMFLRAASGHKWPSGTLSPP